jgi:hypothetical protein
MMLKQGAPGPEVLAHAGLIVQNPGFDSQQRLSHGILKSLSMLPCPAWMIASRAISYHRVKKEQSLQGKEQKGSP